MDASTFDNTGGLACFADALAKSDRWTTVFCDAAFKKAFKTEVKAHKVTVEVVNKIHSHRFEVLPKRWIVERTWAWLMNNRRLQIDYERDPAVTQGLVWAAHTRLLLRRLTEQGYD